MGPKRNALEGQPYYQEYYGGEFENPYRTAQVEADESVVPHYLKGMAGAGGAAATTAMAANPATMALALALLGYGGYNMMAGGEADHRAKRLKYQGN